MRSNGAQMLCDQVYAYPPPPPLPPAATFFFLFESSDSLSISARVMYCSHFARMLSLDLGFFSSADVSEANSSS